MKREIKNIARIYETFLNGVIKTSKKMSSNDLVSIFIGIITNPDEYFKHPNKKNILVTPRGHIAIDAGKFDAFFSYFQKSYTPQEITKFTEIADRLIEDTERRNSGDFWTPTLFCDYAHKMISEQFGEDWKETYVVWDCACGTKNLTRDFKFKELYCSTLFDSELEMSKNYNPEGTSFQFDFLNDFIPAPESLIQDCKLPMGLVQALKENKPIVFFINPPYGKCTGQKNMQAGQTVETEVYKQMKIDKLDGSEFVKQFLYRIVKIKEAYNLTNVHVCCFTNPSWLLKPHGANFRKPWFKNFKFENGIMFCASEFADCSSNWGITFNIWTSGEQEEKNNFVHTLVKRNEDNEIVAIGEKTLYNFDGCQDIITTGNYINYPNKGKKKIKKQDVFCEDLKTLTFKKSFANLYEDYICQMYCNGNDVQPNNMTSITNKKQKSGGGCLQLTKSNLLESCMVLSIKQLITTNWVIDKDQYNMNATIPDTFKYDCLVKALFANYCMSYRLENDSLKNEFFWLSKDEMMNLANENKNHECYNDARADNDRFVYKFINEHWNEFSDDAKAVYLKAKELIEKSFKYRKLFNEENPKYQINNWDAGWYQIKALLKAYMPNELKEFNELRKVFDNRLRHMVYELGFLKK